MKIQSIVPAALLAALTLIRASADPAFTIDNTQGLSLGNPPFTLGFAFQTSTPIVVNQLGLFDSNQDGLAEEHAIGLFDSGGNLLISTTVPAGTGSALVNQFRYESISPYNLPAGSYSVGAVFLSGNDPLIFPGEAANFATAPGITFVNAAFVSGGTLANPGVSGGDSPAYFGPNFTFRATNVPDSGATLPLLGFALSGLGLLRKRLIA